jgi:hypothetical protein
VKQRAILNVVSGKYSFIQSIEKVCFDRRIAMKQSSIKVKSHWGQVVFAEKL